MYYRFESPEGEFSISKYRGRWRLILHFEKIAIFDSPERAAIALYKRETGNPDWDEFKFTVVVPEDLAGWQYVR